MTACPPESVKVDFSYSDQDIALATIPGKSLHATYLLQASTYPCDLLSSAIDVVSFEMHMKEED